MVLYILWPYSMLKYVVKSLYGSILEQVWVKRVEYNVFIDSCTLYKEMKF